MRKIIKAPRGAVAKMAHEFCKSEATIYNYLAFKTRTEEADIIRRKAVSEYGCIETITF